MGTGQQNIPQAQGRESERGDIRFCTPMDLPVIEDPRGKLTFVEGDNHLPFSIARIYYLYDIPAGAERAGHAHRDLKQLFIVLSGSYKMLLDDGRTRKTVTMDSPGRGYYVCPMIWRELSGFTSGATCLVLASLPYSEDDYIRDYQDFLRLTGK